MSTPFDFQDILRVFADYNLAISPVQLLAYALGIVCILSAVKESQNSSRMVSGVLAFFWLWTGIIFNWFYFSRLAPGARVLAVLFVLQGLYFVLAGVFRGALTFRFKADVYGLIGGLMVLYSMIGYPAIEYLLNRGYPQTLPFGLVPCPTTIFTLGVFMWSERRLPGYVYVIPFITALGGLIAAFLGVVEDLGLVAAAVLAFGMTSYLKRQARAAGCQ
jgi:hypothetical protein